MRKHRRDDQWVFVVTLLFLATLLISITVARSSGGGHLLENRGKKERNFGMDKYRQRQQLFRGADDSNSNSNSVTTMKIASRKRYPPRAASVNSILRLDPSMSLWGDSTSICHTVPGLTRDQMELCFRSPDATKVALDGLQLATEECGHQMQKHRWNCSSLQNNTNPHSTHLLQKGYRESAFGHAISAAGVAYAVAKACSQGKLLSCGCGFQYDDQVNYIPSKDADYTFDESNEAVLNRQSDSSWKWKGCSHNMDYGLRFAKTFLDSREKSHDLPSRINLHNNKVGRMAVSGNMDVRCKCHGLSGSCELRTCWRGGTLCCGRGYNTIRQTYTQRCQCSFRWCCEVTCANCTIDEWITVCK